MPVGRLNVDGLSVGNLLRAKVKLLVGAFDDILTGFKLSGNFNIGMLGSKDGLLSGPALKG